MKVVFDILGAPRHSGGMRMHAEQVISAWAHSFPTDRIVVFGPSWAYEEFDGLTNAKVVVWRNESIITRASGQLIGSFLLSLRARPDVTISLSPIVSPFIAKRRSMCFEHDWRHAKRPGEFSRAQHWYRKLWLLSAKHAGVVACISQKAEDETRSLVPSAHTELVPNGRDHPKQWTPALTSPSSMRRIVTFGHHNNKRPDLVIQALELLEASDLELEVLGARDEFRDRLRSLASECGVVERVTFPGFVSDDEYQTAVANADVIVLASSDEGFGLAVPEGHYFGIPVVVAADSGMVEIHGADAVLSAEPSPEGIADAISRALLVGRVPSEDRDIFGWNDTVEILRHSAQKLITG